MASMLKVLKEYFGYKEGETLQQFSAEIKALSDDEKMELATLAAVELGTTVDAPTAKAA